MCVSICTHYMCSGNNLAMGTNHIFDTIDGSNNNNNNSMNSVIMITRILNNTT